LADQPVLGSDNFPNTVGLDERNIISEEAWGRGWGRLGMVT